MSAATTSIKCQNSLLSLRIEIPLIHSWFTLFNLLQNVVDLRPLKGLVATSIFDNLLDILKDFSSDSEGSHKFTNWRHAMLRVGWGGLAKWLASASESAVSWVRGGWNKTVPQNAALWMIFYAWSLSVHCIAGYTHRPGCKYTRLMSLLLQYTRNHEVKM